MKPLIAWLTRRWWVAPLLLYCAALLVRMIYLNQLEAIPTFAHPIMDERYHIQLAEQITGTQPAPKEAFFRAPIYLYFLALAYEATNHSFYWIRFLQILLTSLIPPLIYLLLTRLHSRTVGFWSAAILVWYPMSLHFDTSLLIESIMPLLLVCFAWLLYRASERLRIIDFLFCGVMLGLTALTRPNVFIFIPLLLLWIWFSIKPKLGLTKAFQRYMLIIAACFVVILPVTIRNYVVAHDIVLIAWQGGVNFFIGNNRQANGWSATIPGVDQTWEGEYRETINIPQQALGRTLKASEISDYWYDAAWHEIGLDISHWLGLLCKKTALLCNGYELSNNQSEYMSRIYSPLLRMLLWSEPFYFPFGVLAPLALIGFVLSLAEWRKYLPIYIITVGYALSLILFFVCARFRQPIIPFLVPFAVIAVISLISFSKARKWQSVALWIVVSIPLLIGCNYNLIDVNPKQVHAEEFSTLGNAFVERNQPELATLYYRKAMDADSTYAQAYVSLGVLLAQGGNANEAEQHFRKAIVLAPALTEAYLDLATALLNRQAIAEAIQVLQLAASRFPLNDQVHYRLGLTLFEHGKFDAAVAEIKQAIQLNPTNTAAQTTLNQILDYLKQNQK